MSSLFALKHLGLTVTIDSDLDDVVTMLSHPAIRKTFSKVIVPLACLMILAGAKSPIDDPTCSP